jgi:hypothetical protein
MIHELKTLTGFFDDIRREKKNFEIRENDRNFQVGDTLILREWLPGLNKYSGDEITVTVTYILKGGQFGIHRDYVVMSIQ